MNRVKGETSLKLSDGRMLTLLMDMEALVEAEAAYKKPLATMMADASQGFLGASRALLYGALQARHPDITLREASAMLATDMDIVKDALSMAVELAFPDTKASAEGNAPKAKARGGKTSGASGAEQG